MIGFALFALAPLLFSLYAAFTHWNGLSAPLFSGFSNIRTMAGDPQFWQSLGNTLFLMLGVPIGLAISLTLALALNRQMPGRAAFRVIYYLPGVSSVAAIAILWQWALNGDFGLVNQLLAAVGIDGPNWLAEKMWVKPALIIMGVWKGIGFSTLLYLAAAAVRAAHPPRGGDARRSRRSAALPARHRCRCSAPSPSFSSSPGSSAAPRCSRRSTS